MDIPLTPVTGLILAVLQLGLLRIGIKEIHDRAALGLACGLSIVATGIGSLLWFFSSGLSPFSIAYLGTLAAGLALTWVQRSHALA